MDSDTAIEDLFPDEQRPQDAGLSHPVLVLLEKASLHRLYPINQRETVIGREGPVDIQIADEAISRNHATLIYENIDKPGEDPRCVLHDGGSRNGTYINGERVDGSQLVPLGARILIGNATLVYHVRTQAEIESDERLRNLATRDALTGLLNRGYMNIEFQREHDRATRYRRSMSIILLDIDSFKKINDTYGHAVGDCVLERLGALITECKRTHDLAARYGGEEFAMLLPETNMSGAIVLAERLRRVVENYAIEIEEMTLRITISVGVATLEPDVKESLRSLFNRVDAALLDAKKLGKNCIRTA